MLEEQTPGLRRPAQGPGHRTVDARRDGREAARRQGALRPRRPARARPGAGRGRRATTSPTCSRRVPGADAGAPGRRAGAAGRAGRAGPDGLGLPPAPLGRRRRWPRRRWSGSSPRPARRRSIAHCCAADVPIDAAARRRCRGSLASTSAVLAAGAYDELATALDEGGQVLPRRRAVDRRPAAGDQGRASSACERLLDMLGLRPGRGRRPAGAHAGVRAGRRRLRRTPGVRCGAVREAAAELG